MVWCTGVGPHLLRPKLGCPLAAGLLLLLLKLVSPASRAWRPLLRLLPGKLGSPCLAPAHDDTRCATGSNQVNRHLASLQRAVGATKTSAACTTPAAEMTEHSLFGRPQAHCPLGNVRKPLLIDDPAEASNDRPDWDTVCSDSTNRSLYPTRDVELTWTCAAGDRAATCWRTQQPTGHAGAAARLPWRRQPRPWQSSAHARLA